MNKHSILSIIFMVVVLLGSCAACKIMKEIESPEAYSKRLHSMTDEEVKSEYIKSRQHLEAPPRQFPPGIERDVKWTQEPTYKIEIFNAVVQEIARRCSKAKTTQELILVADKFFMK